MQIVGRDAWTGRAAATVPGQSAEPLTARGNNPVAVLSSIAGFAVTMPTKGLQPLGTRRDRSVNDGGHFHLVEEDKFSFAELRSVSTVILRLNATGKLTM